MIRYNIGTACYKLTRNMVQETESIVRTSQDRRLSAAERISIDIEEQRRSSDQLTPTCMLPWLEPL